MTITESVLTVLLLFTQIVASLEDIRSGIVSNKLVIIASLFFIILQVLGHTDYRLILSGLVCLSSVAILLYVCHVFAAGDSKLLIATSLGLPYAHLQQIPLSLLGIPLAAFALGGLFLLCGVIVKAIQGTYHLQLRSMMKSMLLLGNDLIVFAFLFSTCSFIPHYGVFVASLLMFVYLYWTFFHTWCSKPWVLSLFLFGTLGISLVTHRLPLAPRWIAAMVIYSLIITFAKPCMYETIKIDDLKAHMLLSEASALLIMSASGIPCNPKKRLDEYTTNAIREWGQHLPEKRKTLTIRKVLPFAFCIFLGTVWYLIRKGDFDYVLW